VRLKVLIADDNQDAAESISMILELAGHEVRVAHLGEAALSLAQLFRPDTALLDIGMPDLSGYEVARRLRQEPWASNMQLIALTGWGQERDRRDALEGDSSSPEQTGRPGQAGGSRRRPDNDLTRGRSRPQGCRAGGN
jgi:DNA-binding response OmpR family regulator